MNITMGWIFSGCFFVRVDFVQEQVVRCFCLFCFVLFFVLFFCYCFVFVGGGVVVVDAAVDVVVLCFLRWDVGYVRIHLLSPPAETLYT